MSASKHRFHTGRRNHAQIRVLHLARRLETERPDHDLQQLCHNLITSRAAAGYDITFELEVELRHRIMLARHRYPLAIPA